MTSGLVSLVVAVALLVVVAITDHYPPASAGLVVA